MHDITWTFKLVVKTDSTTGQPSKANMEEMLQYMNVQLEHISDEMDYVYWVEKSEVTSDE